MDSDCKYDVQWAEGVCLRMDTRIRVEKNHSMGAVELRNVLAEYVYKKNMS